MITWARTHPYTTLAACLIGALLGWMAFTSKPWRDYLAVIAALALLAYSARPHNRRSSR